MRAKLRIVGYLLAVMAFLAPSRINSQPQEKKPMVVVVYADWCPLCQRLKPVLALINDNYKDKIQFVRLDLTTEATTAKSRTLARSLGLESFFDKNQGTTSLVVIKDASGHEVFRAVHDYEFQHYAAVLDLQLHRINE